jgi:tRNA dimethylallyltransferase
MKSIEPGAIEKKAIFLAGPTASGKTALAVDLVKTGRFEIISVDSALVYRGMDIGTAKPDRATQEIAPHRLIDICEPTEAYSVARFREDALCAMDEIQAVGKIPLLVGGTMLYFKALQYGISQLPESAPVIRERLEKQLKQDGSTLLHQRLAKIDPEIAKRIHPNDPQRIMRALEVFEISGKPLSELQASTGEQVIDYDLKKFVVAAPSREILHERIAMRFHQMMEQGFEEEVRRLMKIPGMHADLPSMRCVGYRQMLMYFDGAYDRDEMIERGIIATRQLAKRQYTWLRADAEYLWLGENPLHEVLATI